MPAYLIDLTRAAPLLSTRRVRLARCANYPPNYPALHLASSVAGSLRF